MTTAIVKKKKSSETAIVKIKKKPVGPFCNADEVSTRRFMLNKHKLNKINKILYQDYRSIPMNRKYNDEDPKKSRPIRVATPNFLNAAATAMVEEERKKTQVEFENQYAMDLQQGIRQYKVYHMPSKTKPITAKFTTAALNAVTAFILALAREVKGKAVPLSEQLCQAKVKPATLKLALDSIDQNVFAAAATGGQSLIYLSNFDSGAKNTQKAKVNGAQQADAEEGEAEGEGEEAEEAEEAEEVEEE